MKSILISFCFLFIGFSTSAQWICANGRFIDKNFALDSVMDVKYGSNADLNGTNIDLLMDIYLPAGDTASKRPVAIFAHGGTFIAGNKDVIDAKSLAREFAKMGYIGISMNYRLGISILSPQTLKSKFAAAVWRAQQDGRAVIRYMRASHANGNPYKIDPDYIFIGGSSAGGVLAATLAYTDLQSEIPSIVDTMALGGLEGNSGSAGYSSVPKAVVNLCGALSIDVNSMANNANIPLVSVHGTSDGTVPYGCNYFKFLGSNVEILCGSYSMDSMAQTIGMTSALYTMNGEDHVPWVSAAGSTFEPSKKYLYDSAEVFIRDFLHSIVCNTVGENTLSKNQLDILITNDFLEIENYRSNKEVQLEIIDLSGKVIFRETNNSARFSLRSLRENSIYAYRIVAEDKISSGKFIRQIQ